MARSIMGRWRHIGHDPAIRCIESIYLPLLVGTAQPAPRRERARSTRRRSSGCPPTARAADLGPTLHRRSAAAATLSPMAFEPSSLRGVGPGVIDHRLARRALITEYRKGRLARHQVCDAHPELMRAARSIGQATQTDCPICEDHKLVLVTYAFGPRLPKHGRCISNIRDLQELNRRSEQYSAYVVEVCPSCTWHHLLRVLPIGGRRDRRRSGTG